MSNWKNRIVKGDLSRQVIVLIIFVWNLGNGACDFDTKTNFCKGVRCLQGQTCAPAESEGICVDIGGCGDGRLDRDEECDDGNLQDDDGCDRICRMSSCGNGWKTDTEECDDWNQVDDDGCDRNCQITACGNNNVTGLEECDDQNSINGDGCDNNCTITACGNRIRTDLEECDDPHGMNSNNGMCLENCRLAQCGDGYVRTVGIKPEACDDGNLNQCGTCDLKCENEKLPGKAQGVIAVLQPELIVGGNKIFLKDGITTDATVFTFEYLDEPAVPVPGIIYLGTSMSVPVPAHVVARAIAASINRIGSSLLIIASNINPRIVQLVHERFTSSGNGTIMRDGVLDSALGFLSMSGGEAGDCSNGTSCRSDFDCESNRCLLDQSGNKKCAMP